MDATNLRCIDELNVFGKRVIIRVDYNVPYDNEGNITDYFRIEESLKTINYCLDNGAKSVVIMSHRGRPGGKIIDILSMDRVAKALEKLLGRDVTFLPDPIPSEKTEEYCRNPPKNSIIVLENLRFDLGEKGTGKDFLGNVTKCSAEHIKEFRKSLRRLADIYVNDAFGTVHRDHSSMMGDGFEIRAAGFLMKSELKHLSAVLNQTQNTRPLVCILGGNKCEEKIPVMNKMVSIADEILVGGGQGYNFIPVVYKVPVGDTPTSPELVGTIKQIIAKAEKCNCKLNVPTDFYCTDFFIDGKVKLATKDTGIEVGWIGADIGPETLESFRRAIRKAKVILWNGPVGTVKYDKFSNGTRVILEEIVNATKNGCITVAGGGRTGSCLAKWNADGKLSHVSTGGGAFLKILEGKTFPAINVLLKN